MKTLLCILTVVAVAAGAANAGNLAQWKLNEGSGAVAHDSSGNGADMTLDFGSGSWVGGAFNFTGQERFKLDRSANTYFDMSKDFTFSATVNANPNGGTQAIFATTDGENYYMGSRCFGILNGTLFFEAAGVAGMYYGSIPVLDGRIHNVSVQYFASEGIVKTFVDGRLDNQSAAFGAMATVPDYYTFHLGANTFIEGYGLYQPFVGTINNVVITPEPMTMGLLCLGGIAALRSRKK